MSSSNTEIEESSAISSPSQHPKHQQLQNLPSNSSPVISIQSPQSQIYSPIYQGNGSPYMCPKQQTQQPGFPPNYTKQAVQFNYFHQHHDTEHKIIADDLKNFRVAFTSENKDDKLIRSIDFCASGMAGLFNTKDIIKFVWLDPEYPQEHAFKVSKYGSGICRFLNPYDRIIHTSTKVDDFVRLFNVGKNGYDIYFKGHSSEVTGLEAFPLWNNNFVSASKDNTIKYWDIRHENCVKSININKCPLIACHPKDLQVAVAYASDKSTCVIEIYDLRKLETDDPVTKFYFDDQEFEWKVLKFSNNGKYLMINTSSALTLMIDVATGKMCNRLYGYNNKLSLPIDTCFTPDSKFVLGGSQDGKVHIWNLETHDKIILDKPTKGSTNKIIFNPAFMCFATAGEKFHLWIEKQ
ncbi:hypothetical protein ACKWTF_016431 [Chironomus riparius]